MKKLPLFFAAFALAVLGLGVQFSADAPGFGAQPKDPGPRSGPAGAGGFLHGLTAAQLAAAQDGAARFGELEMVGTGLGPRYNSGPGNPGACAECHAAPAAGGTSPAANPQISDATAGGATNSIPAFIAIDGPVREARFVNAPNGQPDGGVHDLFTITGRSDAGQCSLAQPDFSNSGNIIFRIPTPTFGAGLIENIDDATILANQAANRFVKATLGIAGTPNRNGNDGTITRFGWKAQNKSGLIFAGEAYNVEVGVTNEEFQTERPSPGETLPASCKLNPTPEDLGNPGLAGPQVNSDITAFAAFMRLLAPPAPAPPSAAASAGQAAFNLIGCQLCHTPTLTTAASNEAAALSNAPVNLFSDLLLHDMGAGLADRVAQGGASGNQFRTAPLWGAGQRIFFLHDGRCGPANNGLVCAIAAHQSAGSEAARVIQRFNGLPLEQKQNLIAFLRNL